MKTGSRCIQVRHRLAFLRDCPRHVSAFRWLPMAGHDSWSLMLALDKQMWWSGSYSLISHSDKYLPWLSFPATTACKSVLLPCSAVLPTRRRIIVIYNQKTKGALRANSVLHSPGLTTLMVTPVSEVGRIEANCRTAYSWISFVVGYLRSRSVYTSGYSGPRRSIYLLVVIPWFSTSSISPCIFSSSPSAWNDALLPTITKYGEIPNFFPLSCSFGKTRMANNIVLTLFTVNDVSNPSAVDHLPNATPAFSMIASTRSNPEPSWRTL